MEYTDYCVAKGGGDAVCAILAPLAEGAFVIDNQGDFVPFVAIWKAKLRGRWVRSFDWLLTVFDAEGSAWGFSISVDGEELGKATYGDNCEWGIDADDNGLHGELDVVAEALGMTSSELEACLNDEGVDRFCKQVGFAHQYTLYPHERGMPEGVGRLSEL